MSAFPLDHLSGCSPIELCKNCEAGKILRDALKPDVFEQSLTCVRSASVAQDIFGNYIDDKFPLEHLDRCNPLEPCASCKAMKLLEATPGVRQQFIDLARAAKESKERAAREDKEKAENIVTLNSPWVVDLAVTARTANLIANEGCATFRDIVKRTEAEWLRVPGFGLKSLKDLKEALAAFGFSLGQEGS